MQSIRCKYCFGWRDRTRDVIADTDFILAVCRCHLKVGVSNTSSCLLSFSHCFLGFPHSILFTFRSPSLPLSWYCGFWRWSYCLCVGMDGWTRRTLFLEVRRPQWLWLEAILHESFQCGNFAPEMLVLGGGSPSQPSLAVSFTPCQ